MRAQAGGKNVVPDVHEVLGRIKAFSERVRSGEWKGATGKPIQSFVIIGIGGSYLGPEFVCEALRFDAACGTPPRPPPALHSAMPPSLQPSARLRTDSRMAGSGPDGGPDAALPG